MRFASICNLSTIGKRPNLAIDQSLFMSLSDVLLWASVPFVFLTAYFGTKNGYYNTEKYTGDGCAHDVKR